MHNGKNLKGKPMQKTTKDEALSVYDTLKLALEALEDTLSGDLTPYQAAKTITAIREALASGANEQPAQPSKPWVGLTDEEIEEIRIKQEFDQWGISQAAFKHVARAIEAKLKEKNGF